MSTAFARAVVDGVRRHGITVYELPGCWSRGNGQSWPFQSYLGYHAPDGCLTHHVAAPFDAGMSLLRDGRRDLSGPLCNMAGHADGDLTLVAAHPANHAGASGGRSMGPLPTTRAFNARVWGLEVMYPGTVPMTPAQYRTAQILAGVISGILRRPNPEWARFHADTSITGKWDPGYANGRTYDSPAFRRGIWAALHSTPAPPRPEVPDVDANQDRMLRELHREATQRLTRRIDGSTYTDTVLGYAMNADSFGYRATEALGRIEDALDGITTRLAALEAAAPEE